jgi:hypothetical protein
VAKYVSKQSLARLSAESYAREAIRVTIEDAISLMDIMELFEEEGVDEDEAQEIYNLTQNARIEVSWP